VDLTTGNVRDHDPASLLTKITAVAPEGDCPLWGDFLKRVTDDDTELQSFLQRMMGYCLTGSIDEHALFFLYGTGGNGKGVFLNAMTAIFGDYAKVAPADMFTVTQNERHPTDMAMLQGARLVTAQETEEGKFWAEAKIKALTGGDPITARFMRQDFFTYLPQFKLVIAGNHKPRLRNVDEAIRRRIDLVPFTVTIPQWPNMAAFFNGRSTAASNGSASVSRRHAVSAKRRLTTLTPKIRFLSGSRIVASSRKQHGPAWPISMRATLATQQRPARVSIQCGGSPSDYKVSGMSVSVEGSGYTKICLLRLPCRAHRSGTFRVPYGDRTDY
jgi:hypothetical protein